MKENELKKHQKEMALEYLKNRFADARINYDQPPFEDYLRQEIIDDYVFCEENDEYDMDYEIDLGRKSPYWVEHDEIFEEYRSKINEEHLIMLLTDKLTHFQNHIIPYEIAVAKQAKLRHEIYKEGINLQIELDTLLKEVTDVLRALELHIYAEIVETSSMALGIKKLTNEVKEGAPKGKRTKRLKIEPYIQEVLNEKPDAKHSTIANIAFNRFKKSLNDNETINIEDQYNLESIAKWVKEAKKEMENK